MSEASLPPLPPDDDEKGSERGGKKEEEEEEEVASLVMSLDDLGLDKFPKKKKTHMAKRSPSMQYAQKRLSELTPLGCGFEMMGYLQKVPRLVAVDGTTQFATTANRIQSKIYGHLPTGHVHLWQLRFFLVTSRSQCPTLLDLALAKLEEIEDDEEVGGALAFGPPSSSFRLPQKWTKSRRHSQIFRPPSFSVESVWDSPPGSRRESLTHKMSSGSFRWDHLDEGGAGEKKGRGRKGRGPKGSGENRDGDDDDDSLVASKITTTREGRNDWVLTWINKSKDATLEALFEYVRDMSAFYYPKYRFPRRRFGGGRYHRTSVVGHGMRTLRWTRLVKVLGIRRDEKNGTFLYTCECAELGIAMGSVESGGGGGGGDNNDITTSSSKRVPWYHVVAHVVQYRRDGASAEARIEYTRVVAHAAISEGDHLLVCDDMVEPMSWEGVVEKYVDPVTDAEVYHDAEFEEEEEMEEEEGEGGEDDEEEGNDGQIARSGASTSARRFCVRRTKRERARCEALKGAMMYLGGHPTRHVAISLTRVSRVENLWIAGGQSPDELGFTVHLVKSPDVRAGAIVRVFDMRFIVSKNAQYLYCDRVAGLYQRISELETHHRFVSLDRGRVDIVARETDKDRRQGRHVFELVRTDSCKAERTDDDVRVETRLLLAGASAANRIEWQSALRYAAGTRAGEFRGVI